MVCHPRELTKDDIDRTPTCSVCDKEVDTVMTPVLLSVDETSLLNKELSDILKKNGSFDVQELCFCSIHWKLVEDACKINGISIGEDIKSTTEQKQETDMGGCSKCENNHITPKDPSVSLDSILLDDNEMAKKWLKKKKSGKGDLTENDESKIVDDNAKKIAEKVEINPDGAMCDCSCHEESNRLDEMIDNHEQSLPDLDDMTKEEAEHYSKELSKPD